MKKPSLPLLFLFLLGVVVTGQGSRALESSVAAPAVAVVLEFNEKSGAAAAWRVLAGKSTYRVDARRMLALKFDAVSLGEMQGPVVATLVLPVEQYGMAVVDAEKVVSHVESRVVLASAPFADWQANLSNGAMVAEDLRGNSLELASTVLSSEAPARQEPLRLEWTSPDVASLSETLKLGLFLWVAHDAKHPAGTQSVRSLVVAGPGTGGEGPRIEARSAQ